MEELIFNLMSKFIRTDKLSVNIDDLSTVKGIKELLHVDVSLKRSQLSSKVVDVGTKAKLLLLDETVSDINTTKFRKDFVKFYANATDCLIQSFPFDESLIQHAQYLNPRNWTDVKSSNAISNFAWKRGWCYGSVLSRVLYLEPHEKVEDLCDKVRNQWKLYQCQSEQNMFIN